MFKIVCNNTMEVIGKRHSYRDAVEFALEMGLWGEGYSITM